MVGINRLDDPIYAALRNAEACRERCKYTVQLSRKAAPLPVAIGPDGRAAGEDRSLAHAKAQYDAFQGWPYAIIRVIAQRAAASKVKVGRVKKLRRGIKAYEHEDLLTLDQHPILDLIHDPNDLMLGWTLKYLTIVHLELTGRCLWWLGAEGRQDANGAQRPQIWPLPVHWCKPKHDQKLYGAWEVTPTGSTKTMTLPGDEVLHIAYQSPADYFGATSPLQAQARTVDADENIQTAQAAAFKNGINPGLAVILGDLGDGRGTPMLEREQKQQIMHALRRDLQGVINQGQPVILDALIKKLEPITRTNLEMAYRESGDLVKERLFQTFSLNPYMAGQVTGINKAQAVVAERQFLNSCLRPKLDFLGEALTAWMAPRYARDGEQLVIWLEPEAIVDEEQRSKDYEVGMRSGAVTINEWRRDVAGLPPVEGGDELMKPINMISAKEPPPVPEPGPDDKEEV